MAPETEVRLGTHFRRVGEVEVDGRRRISLGKVGIPEHKRYFVSENEAGEILLVPARSIPAREAIVWDNPELLASLVRGMEQAAQGQLEDRGSFAQYVEDDEDTA
jgi:hypothetical protein